MNQLLLFIGSGLLIVWGIAHLFPTKLVVKEFGAISEDNRRIITMEWILEGVTLIFTGVLSTIVTYIDPTNQISVIIYISVVFLLIIMTIVSLLTGFKVNFLPYKLCPLIFMLSATLILIGGIL